MVKKIEIMVKETCVVGKTACETKSPFSLRFLPVKICSY